MFENFKVGFLQHEKFLDDFQNAILRDSNEVIVFISKNEEYLKVYHEKYGIPDDLKVVVLTATYKREIN